jgi:WD40 repeat protein
VHAGGNGVVVAALFDGTIQLLDRDLHVVASVPGARGYVSDVRFTSDGALLAARGNDETVSLYDLAAHQRVGDPITVPTDGVIDVDPAGTELAIAGPDGIVIWSLDRATWIDAACQIADRDLTQAERDSYLAGLDQDVETCPAID